MDKVAYQALQLVKRNRDGSFSTQAARKKCLVQAMSQLKPLGFRNMVVSSLKPKHIKALVSHWKNQGLKDATMKNRTAHLRWLAEKIGKSNIVPSNDALGIGKRTFSSLDSRATNVTTDQLDRVKDPHIRMSLELQAEFGLRREESIKFIPDYADRRDYIALKSSWSKGGRPRVIPIRTQSQREALNRAHALAGKGSLIPSHLRYVDHMRRFESAAKCAGISRTHGLRHLYAQTRYQELTGWKAPAAGGPVNPRGYSREERQALLQEDRAFLTSEQRAVDREARLTISEELGHSREEITTTYLGR